LFLVVLFVGCNSSPASGNKSTHSQSQAACYQHFGVTLSGAEGVGSDYSRPTVDEIKYYNSKGVKLIRLEVRWDKLQPELGGSLNEDELTWVETFVNQAKQQQMLVIIDLHQRSTYNDLNFGNTGTNPDDLANFWKKFAGRLVQDNIPGICGFGIANEPNNEPGFLGMWPNQVNPVIKVISSVDHEHLIFVPEDNWDSSALWNADQAAQIQDTPTQQIVFESHSYWDKDASGDYDPDIPPANSVAAKDLVTRSLTPFVQWCRQTNNKCFVGEFGVPPDENWLKALQYALDYMKSSNVFGCYWAGGPGYSDILSIEPVAGKDKPQMGELEKYLA
jgi:endoglucanase